MRERRRITERCVSTRRQETSSKTQRSRTRSRVLGATAARRSVTRLGREHRPYRLYRHNRYEARSRTAGLCIRRRRVFGSQARDSSFNNEGTRRLRRGHHANNGRTTGAGARPARPTATRLGRSPSFWRIPSRSERERGQDGPFPNCIAARSLPTTRPSRKPRHHAGDLGAVSDRRRPDRRHRPHRIRHVDRSVERLGRAATLDPFRARQIGRYRVPLTRSEA